MDPERLLSVTSGGDELERELLGSIRDVSPPRRAKAETWDGIAGQIATVAVVGAAGATLAATAGASAATAGAAGASAVAPEAAAAGAGAVVAASLKATVVPATTGILRAFAAKVVLGTVVAGSTVAVGTTWVRHHQQSAAVTAPAMEKRTTDEPAAQRASTAVQVAPGVVDPCVNTPDAPPCGPASLPADSSSRASHPSDTGALRSRLSVESQMLTDARAQLRGGDARGALATLDRLQVRSPKGILGQEREVLTIQALAATGNNEAAKRRAKAFILAYPSSPHSTQIRRIAEDL